MIEMYTWDHMMIVFGAFFYGKISLAEACRCWMIYKHREESDVRPGASQRHT